MKILFIVFGIFISLGIFHIYIFDKLFPIFNVGDCFERYTIFNHVMDYELLKIIKINKYTYDVIDYHKNSFRIKKDEVFTNQLIDCPNE